jgi:magnesium-transporting ATPase (P-type)
MASDYAIAQFRFLEKLLLVHGHWCYDRLARLILFFFFKVIALLLVYPVSRPKNIAFTFVIFLFQFFNGFSGSLSIEQVWL